MKWDSSVLFSTFELDEHPGYRCYSLQRWLGTHVIGFVNESLKSYCMRSIALLHRMFNVKVLCYYNAYKHDIYLSSQNASKKHSVVLLFYMV